MTKKARVEVYVNNTNGPECPRCHAVNVDIEPAELTESGYNSIISCMACGEKMGYSVSKVTTYHSQPVYYGGE